jgi:hypothetical protein
MASFLNDTSSGSDTIAKSTKYIDIQPDQRVLILNTITNVKLYIKYTLNTLCFDDINDFLLNILKYSYQGSCDLSQFEFMFDNIKIPSYSESDDMTKSEYDMYSRALIDMIASEEKIISIKLKNRFDKNLMAHSYNEIKHKFYTKEDIDVDTNTTVKLTQFYVKSLNDKSTHIACCLENTLVSDLKCYVSNSEGIPMDQLRFIYNGKQLEDSITLDKYNVVKDANIYLVLRLRGGMFNETSGRNGDYEPLKSVFFDMDTKEFV